MEGHPDYIALDTIHPNAVGNIELAKLVLRTLYDLGLGDKTEPVTKNVGIDEIPFTSYIFRAIRNFFNRITEFLRNIFRR